jgi:hypothetical protein
MRSCTDGKEYHSNPLKESISQISLVVLFFGVPFKSPERNESLRTLVKRAAVTP